MNKKKNTNNIIAIRWAEPMDSFLSVDWVLDQINSDFEQLAKNGGCPPYTEEDIRYLDASLSELEVEMKDKTIWKISHGFAIPNEADVQDAEIRKADPRDDDGSEYGSRHMDTW